MSSAAPSIAAASLSPALRSFEALWLQRSAARSTDPLSNLRDKSMKHVLRTGLPTGRDETWRYTNLRYLTARGFVDAASPIDGPLQMKTASSLMNAEEHAVRVCMVNGYPLLPAADKSWENNLEFSSLRDLSRTDPALIAAHIEPLSDADQGRWTLVNTALFQDGLYIRISGKLKVPLVILQILTANSADAIANPRVIIDAAPGASAIIIEHFVEGGEHQPLCNSAAHISAGADTEIEHYRVFSTGSQGRHIDSLNIRQERNSHCKQFTIALGGGLVRTTLEVGLNQPGASLDSHSLLVGHESRHVDCVNIVTHNARDTRSRQTARAIASGTSRIVFNTKVVVAAAAVHAESQQSSRGLLLSAAAEIDTRPQLEIHADEVKCAHGATIGRLDPGMLFYMLSRGLDRETAQTLLVYAFLTDVLTGMSVISARTAIERALIGQLPDAQILHKFSA